MNSGLSGADIKGMTTLDHRSVRWPDEGRPHDLVRAPRLWMAAALLLTGVTSAWAVLPGPGWDRGFHWGADDGDSLALAAQEPQAAPSQPSDWSTASGDHVSQQATADVAGAVADVMSRMPPGTTMNCSDPTLAGTGTTATCRVRLVSLVTGNQDVGGLVITVPDTPVPDGQPSYSVVSTH